MIPLSIGFALMAFGVIVGILICIIAASRDNKKQIELDEQKITEALEEVIQIAIDNAYIEASRSEGDYDININPDGEQEIREVLENL